MIFSLVSLGCPKNLVDSEHIIARLCLEGQVFTHNEDEADCIILNTCGFIKPAIDESFGEIRRLLAWKKRGAGRKVVVCGCLVNRMKKNLPMRFPGVDRWLKIEEEGSIGDGARRLTEARCVTTLPHVAYLKIAEGCSNRCSYCTIPSIRGELHSRRPRDVLGEARSLAAKGVRELILVAQDTANYGYDFDGRRHLVRLLRSLNEIAALRWIRLLYAHPAHIDERLVEEIAVNPKVCKYVDVPIQHVSDRILKIMNRRHTRRHLEGLLERLRAVPSLALRTTVMVGFPTETEAEFEDLLEFVDHWGFDHLGAFSYSAEPGTKAAGWPQKSANKKAERLARLLELQSRKVRRQNRTKVGQKLRVLVDRCNGQYAIGRSQHEAPDIDGIIRLTGHKLKAGRFYRAEVTGFNKCDLTARLAGG